MLPMTLYTVALLLTLCAPGLDQDDCTFSSDNQIEVLRNVGNRYPGGKTNVKKHEITWLSENGDKGGRVRRGCHKWQCETR